MRRFPLLLTIAALLVLPSAASAASVSGTVFEDRDGDGHAQPDDAGLGNVSVVLDAGADGTVDQTGVTNSAGAYSFSGLATDSYRVRLATRPGWQGTTPEPADVVVAASDAVTGVDFGQFELISISGEVYWDRDEDGVRDPDEDPDHPSTAVLYALDGPRQLRAPTSDGPGRFAFTELGPGTYRMDIRLADVGVSLPPDVTARSGEDVVGNIRLFSGGCWWCEPPPPPPPLASASATVAARQVRIGKDRTVVLRVRCGAKNATSCTGAITLEARLAKGKANRIAHAAFDVPSGTSAKVMMRVSGAAARRASARRKLATTAVVTTLQPGGGPPSVTRSRLLVLPARR